MYLHSSKESNYELGKQIGLRGNALKYFVYALYEVMFDVEVDPETGAATIVAVDGMFVVSKNGGQV